MRGPDARQVGDWPGQPDSSPVSPPTGLQNPIDTMFHLQPLMFLGLFPLFAVFEGTWGPPPRGTSVQRVPRPAPSLSLEAAKVAEIRYGSPFPGGAWFGS